MTNHTPPHKENDPPTPQSTTPTDIPEPNTEEHTTPEEPTNADITEEIHEEDDTLQQERERALTLFRTLKKRISHLPERGMKREIVGELLCQLETGVQVELLQLIVEHSASHTSNAPLLVAVQDQKNAKHQLSYEQTRTLYQEARERDYPGVQRLFLSFNPVRGNTDVPPPGHHQLSGLTLGERKSLARKHNIYLLEKLLLDPDRSVIRNLLLNPRITEKEALFITTRRPNQADILEEVSEHQRWFSRYNIKLALCKNPYTPIPVILRALPFLTTHDLEELLHEHAHFHPQAIAMAEEIIHIRTAPEDAEPLPPLPPEAELPEEFPAPPKQNHRSYIHTLPTEPDKQ
ncbi:MAG TPA: hypothetical protein DCE42_27900 [Myxococcales bacterium]|nr:hypothetical protein [Deltaproteobacteria bacterium]MBU48170.1 hypothetical protein [Deltaproteobacteria bacterium]HAA58618.1 hypothetical protein [Myxococcales bacterium]|tara:strand:- start:10528 stop:11568 length:1041 start_codon:yes stop_codon:yes gene_type:complete